MRRFVLPHDTINCCNCNRLSSEVKREFESLGSTYIGRLAMRDAWAFVGQRGLRGRSTIEEVQCRLCFVKTLDGNFLVRAELTVSCVYRSHGVRTPCECFLC